jgi:glyoxylase-like metal-dependent hydrolase (beta-lactamase superfamily II)
VTVPPTLIDRRTFLADLGHGAVVLAIVGIAGCSPSAVSSLAPTLAPTPPRGGSPGAASPAPTDAGTGGEATSQPPGAGSGEVAWKRVNLGFVSAYLLVRGGEAALVDTGVAGSEGAIEESLRGLGLDWSAVGHVIITHSHGDHAGSRIAVLERAAGATGYAGAEDIPSMGGVELTAVGDGDTVFDLEIVTSPGHTRGSISVLEPRAGILLAGDALRTADGAPALPGEQFTEDMAEAIRSVAKLGALSFETLLPGHGEPIESGAAGLVAELAATA